MRIYETPRVTLHLSFAIAPIIAAVAIFFFINVTDDEPPFGQTQIFNK